MEQTLQQLQGRLRKEFHGFELTQRLQFDWLQTVDAQLGQFHPGFRRSVQLPQFPAPAKQPCDTVPQTRIPAIPSVQTGTIRFVDDSALLDDSDSDSAEQPPPLPHSARSVKLLQSPTIFQEEPRGRTVPAISPIAFQFDDAESREALSTAYDISDDSACGDDQDDEIYERDPIKIHGKVVPHWARSEKLLQHLKRQRNIDADTIFGGFTAECSLALIFDRRKARWENRMGSGWWGPGAMATDPDS
jgi:hypothetical protein